MTRPLADRDTRLVDRKTADGSKPLPTRAARQSPGGRVLGAFAAIGMPPDANGKLSAYLDLLAKWNRTYNLTAIREREQMITHHVHDALAVLPFLPAKPALRLLDVGSGGGIPGIPLAIARPDWTSCCSMRTARKSRS